MGNVGRVVGLFERVFVQVAQALLVLVQREVQVGCLEGLVAVVFELRGDLEDLRARPVAVVGLVFPVIFVGVAGIVRDFGDSRAGRAGNLTAIWF